MRSERNEDWGIFGSLKSTETYDELFSIATSVLLRNFRLAEEHWNVDADRLTFHALPLRNFRLAEEHWNLSAITSLYHCSVLRNFRLAEEHWNTLVAFIKRAIGRGLRNFRLAEEHWNFTITRCVTRFRYYWGIFGSLKSTETAPNIAPAILPMLYWGIFGSLKSTETSTLTALPCTTIIGLRNFRLAEEHWNRSRQIFQ